jgi:hypothetical protein
VKRFTAALALALMFSASAEAADIARLTSPINGMNGIAVSGIIEADDWKKLEELANKMSDYDHTLVVLRSPGGNAAVGCNDGRISGASWLQLRCRGLDAQPACSLYTLAARGRG